MLLGFVFDMEKPTLSSLNLDERAELVLPRNNADRRVAIREFWPCPCVDVILLVFGIPHGGDTVGLKERSRQSRERKSNTGIAAHLSGVVP
jgi:hypothetical protein